MRRAIVTGGTHDDVAPIAVFAINIRNTNSHLFDEMVIFHDGIKQKDQRLINSVFPTRFVKYQYPYESRNDEVLSYFSSMVFCKYECFRLLEEYDEVVWSDYDVVILDKLDDFILRDDDSFHILDGENNLRNMFYSNIVNKEIEQYELDGPGVGTPLFAASNKMKNYSDITKWCYNKTREWDDDLYLPEQCIFSLAVQEFNIRVKKYSFSQYACYPTKAKGDEKIIHAAGQPKFWNGLYNEVWDEMYAEWKKLGGSKYMNWRKILLRKWLFIKTRIMGIRGKEHA